MSAIKMQYLMNEEGTPVGVILPIEKYQELLANLEELEDIRAYDEAINDRGQMIPFEQAIAEIEAQRHDL